MKEDYPEIKLAVIFPFEGFGSQWNEQNRAKLQSILSLADYVNSTSHKEYESPQQLRNHTQFLLEHSGGVILVYDDESPGKAAFFLKAAKRFQEQYPYEIIQIDFDDLQNSIENSYD